MPPEVLHRAISLIETKGCEEREREWIEYLFSWNWLTLLAKGIVLEVDPAKSWKGSSVVGQFFSRP